MELTEGVAAASGKGRRIALYVVSGLLSALYLFASSGKLMSDPQAVEGFRSLGFSDGFRFFIGAAECSGAIGIWIPRLAFWAAVGLIIIMIGAAYTHVSKNELPTAAGIAALALTFVALSRKDTALFLS